jgi:sugar lactone lactonase YvrE
VFDGDRLVADELRPAMRLGRGLVPAGALSDCAFGAVAGPARDTLLVTTNVYGGSSTYVVAEPSGALTALDGLGTLNNEAVVVDGDGAAYLFGDIDSDVSPATRFTCKGW